MNHILEVRRQLFHLICGLVFFFLVVHLDFPSYLYVAIITMVVGVVLKLYYDHNKPHLIWKILSFFDRIKPNEFAGKGSFYFIIGIIISMFFPRDIALACILVVSISDALSTLIGKIFGRTKMFSWSSATLLGTAAFLISAMIILVFFVPFWKALAIALILSLIESFDYHGFILDDNWIVPLLCGVFMLL